jgi:hypothetical protein
VDRTLEGRLLTCFFFKGKEHRALPSSNHTNDSQERKKKNHNGKLINRKLIKIKIKIKMTKKEEDQDEDQDDKESKKKKKKKKEERVGGGRKKERGRITPTK